MLTLTLTTTPLTYQAWAYKLYNISKPTDDSKSVYNKLQDTIGKIGKKYKLMILEKYNAKFAMNL